MTVTYWTVTIILFFKSFPEFAFWSQRRTLCQMVTTKYTIYSISNSLIKCMEKIDTADPGVSLLLTSFELWSQHLPAVTLLFWWKMPLGFSASLAKILANFFFYEHWGNACKFLLYSLQVNFSWCKNILVDYSTITLTFVPDMPISMCFDLWALIFASG